ncbi:MAG TPA: glycosyltransferase [Candidatus Kryptonia bacterium]
MSPKLSLCMIVRNEQDYLPKCLASVKGIVDEIVVVDTGSTDNTLRIAEQHGARVVNQKWGNDFSSARNKSLELATGDWILVLDADEELSPETRAKIKSLISGTKADGLEVCVRSQLPEGDAAVFEDTILVRLFRNKKDYRYFLPIHEQIRQSIERHGGTIAPSDLMITHHGYAKGEVQGIESRAERNLKLLYSTLTDSKDNPYIHYQLGATLMSVGKRDEAYEHLTKVLRMDYTGLGSSILDKLYMKISQLSLERNKFGEAIEFAEKSLEHNPHNEISQYVAAIGYLSNKQIKEGYSYLLRIRETRDGNLRIGAQLSDLISACEKALNI